jgi:ribulose bisphosphate carboxylase small subunit
MKKTIDYYVYAYLRKDGTPYYIGKGKGRRAYDKHGNYIRVPPKDRIVFLYSNLTEEESFQKETETIIHYGRKDLGLGPLRNLSNGGQGQSGYQHLSETKEQIRNTLKEAYSLGRKIVSENHRRIISETHKGKVLSKETKEKLKEFNTGKKLSEETKMKISKSLKGRMPWMNGKKHNEESRKKMSEASKRYWREKSKSSEDTLEKFLG